MGHDGRPPWQPCLCIAHTSTGCNSCHNSPYLWIPASRLTTLRWYVCICPQRVFHVHKYVCTHCCSLSCSPFAHLFVYVSRIYVYAYLCISLNYSMICILLFRSNAYLCIVYINIYLWYTSYRGTFILCMHFFIQKFLSNTYVFHSPSMHIYLALIFSFITVNSNPNFARQGEHHPLLRHCSFN